MRTIPNSSNNFNQHFPVYADPRRPISAEIVDSLRLATRLEDVIAERIPLRRSGRVFVGSCPWHKSKSGRSFVVYPEQQTWRCWGCAIGGDVFSFFMHWAEVSFPAAVKFTAKFAGIELGCNLSEEASRRSSARTELRQIETQIDEILDGEYMRIACELDRMNRMQVRAGRCLSELSSGAVSRFANEIEFCRSALAFAWANLPRLDMEYCLLAFGKSADREKFAMADANERRRIVDDLLAEGYVCGERNYRWEVSLQ